MCEDKELTLKMLADVTRTMTRHRPDSPQVTVGWWMPPAILDDAKRVARLLELQTNGSKYHADVEILVLDSHEEDYEGMTLHLIVIVGEVSKHTYHCQIRPCVAATNGPIVRID